MSAPAVPTGPSRVISSGAAGMLLWVPRTVLALLVAYPLLAAVDASGISDGPAHDAVLFRPGSLLLLELARLGWPWFGAVLKITLLLGALGALGELLPLSSALDVLHEPDRTLRERVALGLRYFPRFLAVAAITWAAQATLLLAASLLDAALKAALQHADERLLSLAPLGLFGLALLGGSWLGGVLDLARAAVVRRGASTRHAVVEALTTLREQPFSVLCGSYVSMIAGLDAALKAALQHADERLLSLAPLGLFGLALLGGSWLGGVLDLARAAVVRRGASTRQAVVEALTTLREQPFSVLCGSYVSMIAGLLGYLVAAWLMTRFDLSGQVPGRIALAFLVHQGAIVFGIAWRVRWLRRALELGATESHLSPGY